MAPDLDDAVVIALGGNLPGRFGSSAKVIAAALARLEDVGLTPLAASSLWRSKAWPDARDPDYLNAVALVETALSPRATLSVLQALEAEFGARSDGRNSPRVLDLDLIAYGRDVLSKGELILPHPRAAERQFVMGPLAEVAPSWRHPVWGLSAEALAASAALGRDAAPIGPVCIAQ